MHATKSKTGTWDFGATCKTCNQIHATKSKAGIWDLEGLVERVRPKLKTHATKSPPKKKATKKSTERVKTKSLQNHYGLLT